MAGSDGGGVEMAIAALYKNLYYFAHAGSGDMVERRKAVAFRGSALDDLRACPIAARHAAGHQIDRVQQGRDPDDWKPMQGIGAGTREIRIREADGAFRVIYVTKFGATVFVLHCFRKTTQKTARSDVALAKRRYADLSKELGS